MQTFTRGIKKTKLITIKDDELLDYISEYSEKILLYNTIMTFVKNKLQDPSNEILQLLKDNGIMNRKGEIDYIRMMNFISYKLIELGFKTHPTRMLLILDDFASHPLLKSKENPLSRFLKKLRHFNINVIICVQTTKSIPRDIKRNLSDAILFAGINEDDFKFLVKESSIGRLGTCNQLWESYSKTKDSHKMIKYHIVAGSIIVS